MAKKPARKDKAPKPQIRNFVVLIGHFVMSAKNGVVVEVHKHDYVFQNKDIALKDFGNRVVIKIPLYMALELDIERYGARVLEIFEPPVQLSLPLKTPR